LLKVLENKADTLAVFEAIGLLEDVRTIALWSCSRFRRCRSRLLQNLSLSDLMLDTLSACAKHCSCLGFEYAVYELSINRVFSEYNFKVLLCREDFLRGGEGGLGADIVCGTILPDDEGL